MSLGLAVVGQHEIFRQMNVNCLGHLLQRSTDATLSDAKMNATGDLKTPEDPCGSGSGGR